MVHPWNKDKTKRPASELKTTKSLEEDLIRKDPREEDRAGDLNKLMGS